LLRLGGWLGRVVIASGRHVKKRGGKYRQRDNGTQNSGGFFGFHFLVLRITLPDFLIRQWP
jgi:hypothetical protein